MSFLYEKQTRLYYIMILLLIALFGISGAVQYNKQEYAIRSIIIDHDAAIASYLIEKGVEENIIANAIVNTNSSERGKAFLGKLGISKAMDAQLLDYVKSIKEYTSTFALIRTALFSILLLGITTLFLIKRDNIYKSAIATVSRYTDGDFSKLLPQYYNGTLYQLFSKINTMATALKSKHETENNTKEFLKNTISDISHQLKTPLAALSMYNEIIQSELDNTQTVDTFSQKSVAAIARIEHLIKTLLKLTRIDSGGIEFQKLKYPIYEVITQSIEELTDRAKKEHKKIDIIGNKEETIVCDIEWTREAIGNIIKNALDHTEKGGIITIGWERTPLMFRISIADNGKGIANDDIHHIFKRFYRSKNSLDTQGIGLGLSLAKSIVEGQDGIITVQSQKGHGTIFILSFPI